MRPFISICSTNGYTSRATNSDTATRIPIAASPAAASAAANTETIRIHPEISTIASITPATSREPTPAAGSSISTASGVTMPSVSADDPAPAATACALIAA